MNKLTPEQRERDRAILDELREFGPLEETRERVHKYLETIQVADMKAALGGPHGLLEELAKDDPDINVEKVRADLDAQLAAGVRVDGELVEREARTAADEMLKTWVSLLHAAWRRRGDRQALSLYPGSLYPQRVDDRWKARFERAQQSLLTSVALLPDDAKELTSIFCTRLRDHIELEHCFELPGGLAICLDGELLVLTSA